MVSPDQIGKIRGSMQRRPQLPPPKTYDAPEFTHMSNTDKSRHTGASCNPHSVQSEAEVTSQPGLQNQASGHVVHKRQDRDKAMGEGRGHPDSTLSHPPQGEARPPARPWAKACAHTHTRDTPPPPSAHSSFQGVGSRSPQTRAPACACALRGLAKSVPGSEPRARPVSAGLPCNRNPRDPLQRPSPPERVPPKLTGDQKAREDGESVHGAAALRRLQCRSSADRAAINLPPSPDATPVRMRGPRPNWAQPDSASRSVPAGREGAERAW